MSEYDGTDQEERGGLAFRNPIKREGWAQIYHVLTLDQDLSDGAFRLYVLLLKYARQNSDCWPGRKRLACDLGTTTRTIERRLSELSEHGLITRQQRGLGRTAMTWIEDLEDVYSINPDKNDEASPDKNVEAGCDKRVEASPDRNVEALAPTDLSGKEHAEEETDMNADDGQQQSMQALTSFGVDRAIARRIAQTRTLEDVQAWIAYANGAKGLRNPVGFIVRRLLDGEVVPKRKKPKRRSVADSWIAAGAQH